MWRCLVIEDEPEHARYIGTGLRELGHAGAHCRASLRRCCWA